ncbi:homoserine kinase [Aegicerativicinus sediminis]|uniref:homoserine kinase n=1 Tax=Aegicerativicinus sediminis TaxID=2893202 RepID=UPI001E40EAFD|nr:homoserine kinase [Aegicerativicinus sediminis]
MITNLKIFSPATVANVSCGFDVLGFCLDGIGDIMIFEKTSEPGIKIEHIDEYGLSTDNSMNVAGITANAMLDHLRLDHGYRIIIDKKIKPGSGIGSSAASASGTAFAINHMLGNPFNKNEITKFAMKGEAFASGAEHADNLAPGIFGGFTLVKSIDPLTILELPTPKELFATIIHPQIEIKTSESRGLLPKEVPLKNAIKQWAELGSLVHALHTSNYDLIKKSLTDVIIEPYRSPLIPYFNDLKRACLDVGGLGCGISGSGPSVFALSRGEDTATTVAEAFKAVYKDAGIGYDVYISPINTHGIKILDN